MVKIAVELSNKLFLVNQTAEELKKIILEKYKKIDIHKTINKTPSNFFINITLMIFLDDYLLKVPGFRSYFIGNTKLIQYDYIRNCINKSLFFNKFYKLIFIFIKIMIKFFLVWLKKIEFFQN